jgi:YidC/Oxa1 family membrane protein insertase
MDRRTLLAVILSVVIITVGFSIQGIIQARNAPPEVAESESAQSEDSQFQTTDPVSTESQSATTTTTAGEPEAVAPTGAIVAVPQDGIRSDPVTYRNDIIAVTLDPVGGSVTSYKLLEHLDGDEPVDMIFRGAEDERAFTLHFGDYTAPPVTDLFVLSRPSDNVFEFSRDYYVVGREDSPFTVVKRYTFEPGEYLFELDVEIRNSTNQLIPLNFNGNAYTIGFGPQIGPEFEKLDQRTEFRRYLVFNDGKRDNLRMRSGEPEIVQDRVDWVALAGKYFAVIALTDNRELTSVLAQEPRAGIPSGSQLYVTRPVIDASRVTDAYQFYVGPKTPRELSRYDSPEDNAWGRGDLELTKVQESRVLLGWLENILKWVLQLIVRVIPNYGVSIIILTIIVKLLLWPLTRKSYQSNARMQAVQPKVQEIREKYKDNQQKMNQEMAALYKKEGVSPLGGCLPLLAQFPFFLAMYGLFNNHFDLRGAVFIPGWISDLSAPDVIFSFGDFTVPLIGWTALRGLPIIFLATQLISTKLTQTPQANQSNMQMKLMQIGLPVVFFFILYNVPSGLLVYWIFSNLITSAQQYYYNKIKKPAPASTSTKGKKKSATERRNVPGVRRKN